MELREGSNEDEDFEDCVDEVNEFEASNIKDQIVPEDSSVIPEYDDKQEIVAEYVDPSSDDGKSFNQWPWVPDRHSNQSQHILHEDSQSHKANQDPSQSSKKTISLISKNEETNDYLIRNKSSLTKASQTSLPYNKSRLQSLSFAAERAYASTIPPPVPVSTKEIEDSPSLCSCFNSIKLEQEWLIWHKLKAIELRVLV